VDSGPARCGVKEEAGEWAGVVGDAGALVGGEECGGIGVAGGEDSESGSGEEGAQASREGEGDVLFLSAVR